MNFLQVVRLLWTHKKKVAGVMVAGASGFVAFAEFTPTQKDDPIAEKVQEVTNKAAKALINLEGVTLP